MVNFWGEKKILTFSPYDCSFSGCQSYTDGTLRGHNDRVVFNILIITA